MRNKFITLVIALTIFTCVTTQALAVRRAIFPDSKSFQPIPSGISPNISGNINSTVNVSPVTETNNQATPTDTTDTVTTQNTGVPSNSNLSFYVIWSMIITIIVILSFIYYFKKRKID